MEKSSSEIYKKAQMYHEQFELNKAIKLYQKAIDIESKAEYHSNLGLAYQQKGWNSYAQTQFRLALESNPDDEIALRYYKGEREEGGISLTKTT